MNDFGPKQILELPIQLFDKKQANLLETLDVEPEYTPSVVAVDVEQIVSMHKINDDCSVINLKNGTNFWICMEYQELLALYLEVQQNIGDVQFFKMKDKKLERIDSNMN
jgi:tricorn protease-like protein